MRPTGIALSVAAAASLVLMTGLLVTSVGATPLPNSAVLNTRIFDDCPSSALATGNNYPASISIADGTLDCFGFANLHNWRFSTDGINAEQFANGDNFSFGANLVIDGPTDGEAGLLLSPWWSPDVDGRFNVRSTDGEIACFGGRLPFYSFTANHGINYVKGTPIHLQITYLANDNDAANPATIEYEVIYGGMTYSSGILPFNEGNPAEDPPHGVWGILTPAYAGGYLQAFLQGGNPAAAVSAVWSDIEFEALDPAAVVIVPRVFDDCPSSTLTTVDAYPALISIDDSVLDCFGYANLHVWRFSEDGTTPRMFSNESIFSFGADLTITGTANGEAGLQISPWWSPLVDGRFNVRSTDGEIACFGGRLPFYSFTANDGINYVKGTTIHLSMSYTPSALSPDYPGTVEYGVEYMGMSYSSGPLSFDMGNPNEDPPHGLWGILSPAYAGGHFQVFLEGGNPEAQAQAVWSNISFEETFPQVVQLDIKPGSCPNPLNLKAKGVTPAAILGTESFDVSTINPMTISLEGLRSKRSAYEDVAGPYMGEDPCGCSYSGGDGIMDLTLKFSTASLVETLIPITEEEVELTIRGLLNDGTPFIGHDCVTLKPANWTDPDPDAVSKFHLNLIGTSEPRAQIQLVQYAIPEESRVELNVYDVSGRVVKQLVQTEQVSGEYTAQWDVHDVPSGIYFYQLKVGTRSLTQKALVVH